LSSNRGHGLRLALCGAPNVATTLASSCEVATLVLGKERHASIRITT
jgi:hypothetical protein